ncbi:MAG: hypothetical protein LBI42_03280 [Chitinispirillales bacterium]|nr:hypothetical protein [Chitinispirillales bacterium]
MKKATVLIASALCALVMAQPALSAKAKNGESSPIVSANTNPALKAPITLNAREASLSEVLRVLADRSGMNFVVAEGVHREKISIILNNTPLDEAINLLVRASGLSYEIIGNSILIAEAGKLKDEVGLSSYVVELKYAKADEVAASLADLTKSIKVDKGGNRLICFTSPRMILEIERIVKALDQPHTLVLLETRLIEVEMTKLGKYGVNWEMLAGGEAGLTTALTVPGQPVSKGFNFGGGERTAFQIDAAVNLMLRNNDARILMDSKLTTTNNREASLHIGKVIPYVIQSYNLSGSGGANQQIEKENVGTMVTMTPHINDKNQITLSLKPEVSTIAEWRGPNLDIPVVSTRKTSTTVRVENGQKVILAGLLNEEIIESVNKLPILGDIPIIGALFRNKRSDVLKKNLIIEVVPRIINNPAEIAQFMRTQYPTESGTEHAGESAPAAAAAPVQAVAIPAVVEPESQTDTKAAPAE